jgi:hypothetical protein
MGLRECWEFGLRDWREGRRRGEEEFGGIGEISRTGEGKLQAVSERGEELVGVWRKPDFFPGLSKQEAGEGAEKKEEKGGERKKGRSGEKKKLDNHFGVGRGGETEAPEW